MAERAGIFISYRRADAGYPAGWLYDWLAGHFGEGRVFKDVDSLRPGDDFAEVIGAALDSCAVLLAVIGQRWLTATGADGRRRLDRPDDFVRQEIETALRRDVPILLVLVDGAVMPGEAELPAVLSRLAYQHALELSPDRFGSDAQRLLQALHALLAAEAAPAARPEETGAADQVSAASAAGRARSRVWWALVPVLSLGLLLPLPCVHAALRMRNLELWVVALLYVILWVTLLSVIAVQSSLGHQSAALVASGWLLFSAVLATMHAFRLRHRAFSG